MRVAGSGAFELARLSQKLSPYLAWRLFIYVCVFFLYIPVMFVVAVVSEVLACLVCAGREYITLGYVLCMEVKSAWAARELRQEFKRLKAALQ